MKQLAHLSILLSLGLLVAGVGCDAGADVQPGANLPALDEPDAAVDGKLVAPPEDTTMPYPPLPKGGE